MLHLNQCLLLNTKNAQQCHIKELNPSFLSGLLSKGNTHRKNLCMERLVDGMQELLSSYQTGLLTSPSRSPTMACTPTQLFTNHSG